MLRRFRRRIASERASVYLEYALVTSITLAIAVARRQNRPQHVSRYPEEKIMIG